MVPPEGLLDAIKAAENGATITLGEGIYTTYGTVVAKGKTLTFVGAGVGKTTWAYGKNSSASGEGGSDYSLEGANVTFKSLTLKDNYDVNSYYRGFVRPKSMHFENCEFLNMAGYFGDSNSDGVWFKDCVFNVNKVCEYCVKTYGGSDFYFDGCTFNAANKGFIQLYIQDNSKTHNAYVKDCTFNKVEGNTATMKTAVYWYNYNGSSEGADWNICFAGNNINNAGISANATSGTWMYEWKYTNTATVYNNGVCVMNDGVAQTITESEVPSSVAQTVADVAVTKDETATEVESSAATAAVNTVVANTATVNETTTIAAESVEGVSSTKNYLHIDVKAAEVAKNEEQAYVKSMTFDIKPIAATITDGKLSTEVIPNDNIKSAITFRLPVDANATETTAEVFHNGESMGADYQVQGTTEKYIEVSTTEFSEFGYQLLDAPAATYVGQIGEVKYETLNDALTAVQNGETITLIADLENTGNVSLKAGVTLDGDNHKISGNSAIHINAVGGTVKNVKFENIHNDAVVGANQYGLPESAVGTQTAIEASGLTGAVTITGCTFDNCDWDAIRVVPSKDAGEDLAITITNNIFKHTNAAAHQLRYIHLEYVQGTSNVGRVSALLSITDNQFLDQNQSERTITAILAAKMDANDGSNLSGNYYSNRDAIEVAMSYNVSIEDFYPMRSQADVDVDDLQIETAQIGTTKYATLAAAFEAANASSATSTIKLLRDVVVNETYTVNNTSSKWIALDLNGHNLTATVPVVNAYTQFNYQNTGKDALTTVPEDGNLFTIQDGVKLLFASGIFSSNSVEKYLDNSAHYLKDNGNGTYTITPWSEAEAIATGRVITVNWSGNKYFKTLKEVVDYAKANAKTSASPKLLADVTSAEEVETTLTTLTINPNGYTFKGAVNSTGTVALSTTSTTGTVNFTKLIAATLANNKSTAAIIIEDGNVEALTTGTGVTPNLTIKGGTYGFDPTAYVAEGYEAIDNGNGTWSIEQVKVAQIGETKYTTLAAAVAAAQNEDEIVVLSNYKGSDESPLIVVDGKTLTLNLNGYTIEGSGCDGVIWAKNSANVTIQGNGTVIANECKNCDPSEGYGYAVRATKNSTITIKDGSYKLIAYNLATQKDMIYASGASTINIEGGNFMSDVPGFTLNLQDNSGSKMSVTGGTFYGFNPEDNNAEGEYTNFVAEGYTAEDNGDGSYTVVACAYVAQIGVANYATLAEAVAAAQNGQTIKMIADAQANAMVEISGKSITLDLNGKTISPVEGTKISGGLIGVHNGASLTIDDTSYAKLGTITSGTDGKVYGAVQVTVKGDADTEPATLVVKNGNLEGYYYGIVGNGDRHNTDITIEGGTITGLANSPATDDMGYAIYHPQAGTLTISGGTLVGPAAAIEMRAGELNITGGSFEATATAFKEAWNGNGTTITGAAIAISQHSTNKDIKVDISGGTFTGIKALYEKDLNPSLEDNSYNINLAVEGGSFNGAIYSQNDEEFISGGLFSDPNADIYCKQNLTVANKAQGSELLKVEDLTDETAIVAITESDNDKIYYSKLQAENRYLSLEDGIKSIDVKEKVAFKDIAYHRTFNASAGYWQAWIAPFDCTPSSYYYDFAEISMLAYYRPSEKKVVTDNVQAGDELVIVLNPLGYGARVKANYPYCVRVPEYRKGDSMTFFAEDDNDAKTYLHKTEPKQISSSTTSRKFTFNGVYEQTSMTDIYMVATDGSYSHMTKAKTVNPFRWYFTITNDSQYGSAPDYSNSNIRFLVFGEDEEATAIMNAINNHPEAEQIYDLSGRLIQQMGHGVSIINGKKVINN